MSEHRNYKHTHSRLILSYPVSVGQRLYAGLAMPVITIIVLILLFSVFSAAKPLASPISLMYLVMGLGASFGRLLIAYTLALVIALPLAFIVGRSDRAERILFPIFDVVQSVPVLAFFPVVVWIFIKFNFFDGAAIFLLFMSMLGILFSAWLAGLK